jgi:predicted metal-dependent hydrolase
MLTPIYKASPRAKKLRITVKGNGDVVISYPKSISKKEAATFFEKHQDWVEKQLKKLEEKNPKAFSNYNFGSEFKTKLTTFRILASEEEKPYLRQEKDYLNLYLPKNKDLSTIEWQELIVEQIEEQLRREAKHYLIKRCYDIAKEKGIPVAKVTVRKAKTRWGSCSSRNNISLSIYCMTLPDELIDYIIHHELAHVKEKNHAKDFWAHLEGLLPGAMLLDKQLNKFTTHLI